MDIETTGSLSTETLVPIGKAGKIFPCPVGRTSLERWMRDGVRGVRLESLLVGSRRFTSIEAVHRFIARSNIDCSGAASEIPRRSVVELAIENAAMEVGLIQKRSQR